MMRKIWVVLLAVVAIIIFIVLAAPFGMGLWVQKRYPQALTQFNTPHVSFKLANFKRGWFSSRAQLQVVFHSAETTLSGESIPLAEFIITQNIQHGPLVMQKSANGSHHWIFARAAMQNESRADNLVFKANTLWTMTNNLNTQLNIQHLLLGNERQRIEVSELTGNISFTPTDRHFQSQLTLGSGALYASNPEKVGDNIIDLVKVMQLDHFSTHLDIHKIETLWYGNRHFEAEKVMIFPYGGGDVLTANQVTVDLNQSQRNSVTDFSLTNHVDTMTSGQTKINQLQIALALKDMNTALLENFAHVFMYGSDFQRFKLYSLLLDLFTKGMTVNLSQLQFTTDEGPVAIQARIDSVAADAENAGLLHLLENLNIEASANMPKAWLQKNLIAYYQNKNDENPSSTVDAKTLAQRYIDHWLTHHLLVAQDQQVTIALDYKDGKLLINGEKPSIDHFLFNDAIPGVR